MTTIDLAAAQRIVETKVRDHPEEAAVLASLVLSEFAPWACSATPAVRRSVRRRADPALRRIGRMTTARCPRRHPDMYRQGLEKIATAASEAARTFDGGFGAAHLLFTRIDDT